jgi:hypothetical protein
MVSDTRNWSVVPTQVMHCAPALKQINVLFFIQFGFHDVDKLRSSDYFDVRLARVPNIHLYGFSDTFLVDFITDDLSWHEVVEITSQDYQQTLIIHPFSRSSEGVFVEDYRKTIQRNLAKAAATSDHAHVPTRFRVLRKVLIALISHRS